ncbi:hypothetical protein [Actinokineospora diospyrosa]|uniref:HTH cro/C1-type domain-containing protein n=1 Tax=Actinokineospora diospyrosa TaxID=103728 RepID=A0ABT1IA81_9PSEU|nr:hypothetical protein [Actinokineospora diospyrosa]MCP2269266.1 hypothetical protein [Actinokineospora diospyrosa]
MPHNTGNWADVAALIQRRMTHLGITEPQLALRSRVSLTVVKELARNTKQSNRHRLTLSRLSRALGLDLDHLRELATRPTPKPHPVALGELHHADIPPALRHLITDIVDRLDTALRDIRAEHAQLAHDARIIRTIAESVPTGHHEQPADTPTG